MKSDTDHRVYQMSFAGVYPHLLNKVVKKGRTKAELHEVIRWLTGYTEKGLEKVIKDKVTMEQFFKDAPKMNPSAKKITGVICGVRIEEIEHPLMKRIRWMDKLVDELAKGRPMEKVLR